MKREHLKELGYGSKWQYLPFNEAVEINPPVSLEPGHIYPFVDMQAVEPHSRTVRPREYREFKGSGSRFAEGDTLMARITPCLENGKITRFYSDGQHTVGHGSTEFIVIRGRAGVTDNDFAYYLTCWDYVRQYAISQMTGTSGRQRVPISAFSHLEVPIPPLPEQRAIAHILGTLDDKIELNQRMNETLEAMARALFKSWFVDFDPVIDNALKAGNPIPDTLTEKAKRRLALGGKRRPLPEHIRRLFPARFVDSRLGPIPAGWEIKSLDEIAEYLNGIAWQKYRARKSEPSLPVIKIRELRDGITSASDRASVDVPEEYIVEDGDVLFSWSGSLLVKIWCGGKGVLNQHLFKVSSKHYPKWFYYLWTSEHLDRFRRIAADKATTMGHIKR
nr:restriction endonuclease subunit S [Bacillota bacterium]